MPRKKKNEAPSTEVEEVVVEEIIEEPVEIETISQIIKLCEG